VRRPVHAGHKRNGAANASSVGDQYPNDVRPAVEKLDSVLHDVVRSKQRAGTNWGLIMGVASAIGTTKIRPESRATFENQGVSLTKMNVQMGNMDGRVQLEALHWIAEQERESTRRDNLRYWSMPFVAVVAALGAVIAAWPVVREWFIG
jgi:hypothetical protein